MPFRFLTILLLYLAMTAASQAQSRWAAGRLAEQGEGGSFTPLVGARVVQLNGTAGAYTDSTGKFAFALADSLPASIVAYYSGYEPDTFPIVNQLSAPAYPLHVLRKSKQLKEVSITGRAQSHFISSMRTEKTEVLTRLELGKAACCNLGESFETSPTIDVAYTDAVTGARQISMMGLAGVYTQITTESLPLTQGLGRAFGLSYIPGPWVQSIYVSKGPGSVVNGYEAMVGQVNVEIKKPDDERLHLNAYANSWGRYEANVGLDQNLKRDGTSRWGTALLTHASTVSRANDFNGDGFVDVPLTTQFNLLNRWQYKGTRGLQAQIGVNGIYESRLGGQLAFVSTRDTAQRANTFGNTTTTHRGVLFGKLGYIHPTKPYRGFGLQGAVVFQQQGSQYGPTLIGQQDYYGRQRRTYFNFIYEDIISTTSHSYRVGISYLHDDYLELFQLAPYYRTEQVPGAFLEYTYKHLEKFDVQLGLRIDQHNLYGTYYTPRVHLRYQVTPTTTLRASAGRGYRTANVFIENSFVFATSRFVFAAEALRPEVSWNYGINLTQKFTLAGREGSIGLDLYRTDFENQVVVDMDQHPNMIMFYNLRGRSYGNNLQLDAQYEVLNHLTLRAAYKWYDVHTSMYLPSGELALLRRQLVPQHRAMVNLAYTPARWKLDATLQWYGPQRLPITTTLPAQFQQPEYSSSYAQVLAQVTRIIQKWEVYVGGENLLNYLQPAPITSPADTRSPYFDSSFVWGPLLSRTFYIGFRYSL